MLVLGTLYLIWLAVKILRSTYDTKAVEPKKWTSVSLWFVTAVCKRKSNGVGHRLHPMFVLPYYQSTEALAAFAIFIAIAGTSCNLVWSGFGSVASKLFANHTKLITQFWLFRWFSAPPVFGSNQLHSGKLPHLFNSSFLYDPTSLLL